jgi:hypothetical protein
VSITHATFAKMPHTAATAADTVQPPLSVHA